MTIPGSGHGASHGASHGGMGPGSGSITPVMGPLSTGGANLFSPDAFLDADIHPDLWAMAQTPKIVCEFSDDDYEAFATAVGGWAPQDIVSVLLGKKTIVDTNTIDEAFKQDLAQALSSEQENRRSLQGEIIDQSGRFDHYYYTLFSLNPRTHPYTTRLISVGMQIAGIVGMQFKIKLMRPRPVQVRPGIFPLIPTPPHPSFPSNHATQAFTVSRLISNSLSGARRENIKPSVKKLAERIATNREIAGVHFETDTHAGRRLAKVLSKRLGEIDIVRQLQDGCRNELNFFAPTEFAAP